MNLITVFRDMDSNVIADFDEQDGVSAVIFGNRLTVYADDGTVLGRARLELDHNVPVWRLFKGARGREIGIAVELSFSV